MTGRSTTAAVQKRPANVSVRSDLLTAVRAAGINLSASLERALTEELAAAQRKKWRGLSFHYAEAVSMS